MNRKVSITVIYTEIKVRTISLPKQSKTKHKLGEHLRRALLSVSNERK